MIAASANLLRPLAGVLTSLLAGKAVDLKEPEVLERVQTGQYLQMLMSPNMSSQRLVQS